MEDRSKIHVGLDVHKDSISVATAEPGRAPGRLIGKVPHDVNKLLKMLAKVGTAEQLHIVRGWSDGLRAAACLEGQGLPVRDHCPVADPATTRGPNQDRLTR